MFDTLNDKNRASEGPEERKSRLKRYMITVLVCATAFGALYAFFILYD
ncbi:MAG: hypothetical protein LAQ30_01750 [Acidobacteriia bacterium]|nr:hypothetical protein [Terriglobia bacterium]